MTQIKPVVKRANQPPKQPVADAPANAPPGKPHTRPGRKTRRRQARELALQGLYQWCVAGGTVEAIEAQLHETREFPKTDEEYFSGLLRGVLGNVSQLEKQIQPYLDRPLKELSPVEISILLLGTHELESHPEIPYRAVINEAVELAKTYGGTHGHKYVNGVLDKLAAKLRAAEVNAKF
ncbi:transcription antitermination factor NusB [Nitrosovibrio sp. Nv6]|uniref:transcription antitermination factor NusB n=1 Tax=Nitrosovibrio sp. Nv6 TaxID=1855340 RepID=UPI0008C280FB|nr:transcription antitermination factor NusB [Nitrosovibrio sp. Nv6]SEP38093.1 N utilization substance protein B [Nitrosovibrio sp. Nv6]